MEAEVQATYCFESRDSLAQFGAWLLHAHLAVFVPLVALELTGWQGVVAWLLLAAGHIAGLRGSIRVTPGQVVIVKKWFFLPYKSHRAARIDDVWFGGDWGLEEGAICVVVELGGQEVTLGTSRNMHDLYADLSADLHPHASKPRADATNPRHAAP
jgi:hypothetical protein